MSATERDQIRQAADRVLGIITADDPPADSPQAQRAQDKAERVAVGEALRTIGASTLCDLNRTADALERLALASAVTAGIITPEQARAEFGTWPPAS